MMGESQVIDGSFVDVFMGGLIEDELEIYMVEKEC